MLIGNGDGTFRPAATYAAGTLILSIAVGDFNGDGKADLAVPNWDNNGNIAILLGKGDGTFAPAVNFSGGQSGFGQGALALADFNGDGIPDLAANTGNANMLSLFLGNGDGSFRLAYTSNGGGAQMTTGDFNGDGKTDLAVAGNEVLLGNGDGTFQPAVYYPVAADLYLTDSVVAVDVNGDGNIDLVSSGYDLSGHGSVSLFLGNGDGTFQAPVMYPVTEQPAGLAIAAVAVADFNGDGRADVAAANYGTNNVSMLLGSAPASAGPTISPGGVVPVYSSTPPFSQAPGYRSTEPTLRRKPRSGTAISQPRSAA